MTRAAIYIRISLDRQGVSDSPARQEDDCRSLCAAKGWEVHKVYEDRDLSAFSKRVKRPGYEQLLKDLANGVVDALVVWKLDRLTRQGITGLHQVLSALDEHRAVLVSCTEALDTTTPMGRGVVGIIASIAEQESENTRLRVSRAHTSAAIAGKMHRGGARQYGYNRDSTIVPEEAANLREAAGRLLEGESLRKVAFDFNDRGIRTSLGKEWHAVTLGSCLRSPRLVGVRVHNGDSYPGDWEPIFTPEEHTRLLAHLESRKDASGSAGTGGTRAAGLLAGLVRCGECGVPMKVGGSFTNKKGEKFLRIGCVKQPARDSCGRVVVARVALESLVVSRVLDAISSSRMRPLHSGNTLEELSRALEADELALVELTTARFVQRTVGDAEYTPARQALQQRIETAAASIEALKLDASVKFPVGDRVALDAWWDKATIFDQREVLRRALHHVTVNRAAHRGGNKFQTERVHLKWRMSFIASSSAEFTKAWTEDDWLANVDEYHREQVALLRAEFGDERLN